MLGPLIFNIFMNDLVYAVRQSTLSAYADDTQIFFADSTAEKVEEVINADLANVDKWYEQNGLSLKVGRGDAGTSELGGARGFEDVIAPDFCAELVKYFFLRVKCKII